MKKDMMTMTLAAGLLGGVANVAQAQANITIYGLIDLGVNYTSNVGGKNSLQMESGYAEGSRVGLQGSEDLGGGLSTLFQIENGFAADTGNLGQGGLIFGRQALVGLSSKTTGAITLGRQYDSVVDYLAPMTANGNWAGYLFAHPLDNDNTNNSFRVNNSIKYSSPSFSGLQFGGLYGFGETPGDHARNRTYSLGASYSNDSVSVGVGYMNLNSPASTGIGNGSITPADANFTGMHGRQKIVGAGVNYTIGATTVGVVYTNTILLNPDGGNASIASFLPASGKLNSLRFNNYEVNAKYQISPAFYIGAMYSYTSGKFNTTENTSNPTWSMLGLMADYSFSKRTDVYLQGSYQKTGGNLTGSSLDQAYVSGSAGSSGNGRQVTVRLAIRHKF